MTPRRKKPEAIGNVLSNILEQAGIASRVEQARVVPEWVTLVGPQIAAVTFPIAVTVDGTLFVDVTTNAWMTELSLMEPELLRALNSVPDRPKIRKIHWRLKRPDG